MASDEPESPTCARCGHESGVDPAQHNGEFVCIVCYDWLMEIGEGEDVSE